MSQAASPASSAPSPSASAPVAPKTVGGSPAAEGGDFDYKSEFTRTRKDLDDTRAGMEGLTRKTQEQEKTLGKLREAFDPNAGEQGGDPIEAIDAEMDSIINAAYEADKAGRPIPMTAKAYLAALQTRKDHLEFQKEIREELKKIGGQAQQANDPQMTVNRQAYSNIDSFVQQGLDQIYGLDESYLGVKKEQFGSLTRQMSATVREMQAKNPGAWDRMRRDPQLQRQFVNQYLRQNLPPRAVEILERENLQNTPMSQQELFKAFDEAKAIKDPKARAELRTKIRQDILSHMGPQDRRARG